MKTRLLLTLTALLLALSAWAAGTEIDGIYYYLDSSTETASVTYTGSYSSSNNTYSGDITIPASVNYSGTTYSVTSIGNYAFEGCTGLTSITIPNSVTSIGYFEQIFNRGNQLDMIVATGHQGVVMSRIAPRIRETVARAHYVDPTDEQGAMVFNTEVLFQLLDNLFRGVNFLIWLVGLGTLLAGAIGVSNIMMVTVRERTTEIGIRRAIGATPRMILSQIISESIVLTLVAGMSGILVAVIILQMLEMGNTEDGIVSAHFQVGFWTALFAAFVVSLMGVIAGLAPAARAMSIKPVDAMRDE